MLWSVVVVVVVLVGSLLLLLIVALLQVPSASVLFCSVADDVFHICARGPPARAGYPPAVKLFLSTSFCACIYALYTLICVNEHAHYMYSCK